MSRRHTELVAASLFGILFAVLLWNGLSYGNRSAYMPSAASGLGLLMCIAWAIGVFVTTQGEAAAPMATQADVRRFLIIVCAGAAFVAGFFWVGFFTTTLIFVPALSYAFGYRNALVIGLTTVGFVVVLYIVFRALLAVPLPPDRLLTMAGF
ncbi:tripartite tricarboxylate transporter TctB family protein [Salipiger thiooxidans]|uniref:tripartite tricarboxylate transporter TctB family protein n=1 Tax=Salipiger thiooxidans TaxID=282683 RepID=UPI001CD3B7F7|nr:tripartite tricarboxylate transporter TctB family protein [Salipiger thiooxidans]MCA0851255.1 tripartite tricarboxylate transporter TctB family protein [Salipiger thiooxidans]